MRRRLRPTQLNQTSNPRLSQMRLPHPTTPATWRLLTSLASSPRTRWRYLTSRPRRQTLRPPSLMANLRERTSLPNLLARKPRYPPLFRLQKSQNTSRCLPIWPPFGYASPRRSPRAGRRETLMVPMASQSTPGKNSSSHAARSRHSGRYTSSR